MPLCHLTISLGVDCINNERDNNTSDMFAKVDNALYAAKRDGRNRVSMNSAMDLKQKQKVIKNLY